MKKKDFLFNILNKITFKRCLIFLGSFLIIGIVLLLTSFIFKNPNFQNFQEYKTLNNWDIMGVAIDDFDYDGKRDSVSPNGCAFLSSVKENNNIPVDKKCINQSSTNILYDTSLKVVGQKIVDISDTDLKKLTEKPALSYGYMGKTQEGKWIIYAERKGKVYMSEINNGQIKKIDIIPFATKIDRSLYHVSAFSFMIGLLIVYFMSPAVIPFVIVIYVIKTILFKTILKRKNK